MSISATGDNCLGLTTTEGKVVSSNLCTTPYKILANPAVDTTKYLITTPQKTVGATALKVNFCLPLADKTTCISKSQILTITPGKLAKVTIAAPTNVLMQ